MNQGAVPLDQPLYGASFGQAVSRFFRKFATFTGRASRSEYWWVALFTALVYLVLSIIAGVLGGLTSPGNGEAGPGFVPVAILLGLFWLATVIPGIALTVRRLHDVNLAGWLIFLNLLPSVGSVILLVLSVLPSSPLGVRFDDQTIKRQYS